MKTKKHLRQDFEKIMNLSEEIALQISVSNLLSPYYKGDSQQFFEDTSELLKTIDCLSAEINKISHENAYK